jgi:hypothetical protein
MNDTLKAAGRIGAELGAAKAENEKLRGLLCLVAKRVRNGSAVDRIILERIDAALSQKAKPTETFTAVEMATAAAQGFRDGQAAVEPVPVQDEQTRFEAWAKTQGDKWLIVGGLQWSAGTDDYASARTNAAWAAWQERAALSARPAQTEQQPVMFANAKELAERSESPCCDWSATDYCTVPLYAAPIAQTAPQGKFRMGDMVKKSTGSEWVGRVVGWYSTALTPEGYAVESETHAGSVQIYPAKALEAVDD